MKDVIIMLTKDAFGKFNLPIYGNKYWKTPNINELASKGTVFNRHYTASPSTVMSFTSAFFGYFPYTSDNLIYKTEFMNNRGDKSYCDVLHEMGYDCHLIIPDGWKLDKLTKCFGKHHHYHDCVNEQKVGPHFNAHNEPFKYDKKAEETAFQNIKDTFESIDTSKKTFIWCHLPHVLMGYTGYGSDVEFFDKIVGYVRERYGDDSLFISADHGHSNFSRGNICYGFHVYDTETCIPLITPRLEDTAEVNHPTSNIDIFKIMTERKIPKRDHIISDTAYYGQPKRMICIVKKNYKYIYVKQTNTEELYDLDFDPNEEHNIISTHVIDKDRNLNVCISDEYFYPYWERSFEALKELREIKQQIYRSASKWYMFRFYMKPYFIKLAFKRITRKIFR